MIEKYKRIFSRYYNSLFTILEGIRYYQKVYSSISILQLDEYLEHKRIVGWRIHQHGRLLNRENFVFFIFLAKIKISKNNFDRE